MTDIKGDARERCGVLERSEENTRVCVDMYSTTACLANSVYSQTRL
jgi:hypothetical protein